MSVISSVSLDIWDQFDIDVPGHGGEGDLEATDGSGLVLMMDISFPLDARASRLKY